LAKYFDSRKAAKYAKELILKNNILGDLGAFA